LEVTGIAYLTAKHPDHLSLGQRKRVAIASVLVTDNRLLVLDEPSAGLDPAGRESLLGLLQSLPVTMVIATHDLDLATRLCTRAIAIRDGRVYRMGSPAELAADPSVFARPDPQP
jgi:cobalt/nickel transport system ATP-binding protein